MNATNTLQVLVYLFTMASCAGFVVALLILVDGARNYQAVSQNKNLRLTALLWVAAGVIAAFGQGKLAVLGLIVSRTPIRDSFINAVIVPTYAAAAVVVLAVSLWILRQRVTMREIVSRSVRLEAAQEGSASVILDASTLKIIMWSDEAQALFGWAPEEVVGRDMAAWLVPIPWTVASDWLLLRKGSTDANGTTVGRARTKTNEEIQLSLYVFGDSMATRPVFVGYFRPTRGADDPLQ